MAEYSDLKKQIFDKIIDLGADIIRSCNVEKWEEIPMQESEFWTQNIWPWVKNVIVFGIPLYTPMMSTSPSMVSQELYDTTNRVLDELLRVCRPGGKIIIPTYINDENEGSPSTFVKVVGKLGADFKAQFTYRSYKEFFLNRGYTCRFGIIRGSMPCAIAVIDEDAAR